MDRYKSGLEYKQIIDIQLITQAICFTIWKRKKCNTNLVDLRNHFPRSSLDLEAHPEARLEGQID